MDNSATQVNEGVIPEYKNIQHERRENTALVTVSRPEKYNALTHDTLVELEDCFTRLAKDKSVRAVVVTGAGEKAFVAGADIAELAALDALGAQETSIYGQHVFNLIASFPQPVIAAVNGFALGGGCELAVACHIRIASENAKLGLPEVGLGIIPGYGGTQRLPRLVGSGYAIEMICTGQPVDAAEAKRIGLVNDVVPQAELLDHCLKLAGKIAKQGPLAVSSGLKSAMRGLEMPIEAGLELESTYFGLLGGTEDMHDGLKAFLEKRKPDFRGR
jgi:enoyl-CoA hydratase